MSDNLVSWLFENEHLIRSVERASDPWFVGNDLCRVLELAKPHQALERLDDDERGTCIIGTPGGPQEMVVVSEPGLFRLVFTSRKPVAERFKRWIAHDVLPAIRKTGRFEGVPTTDTASAAPTAPRSFDEWTPAELNSKVGAVAEYRMSINPGAGQWAMQRLGFPMPPRHITGGLQGLLDLYPNT